MNQREYHYLISGLPVISPDEPLSVSLSDFRQQLKAHLHEEDFELVKLLLLQKDHDQLVSWLEQQNGAENESIQIASANYSLEELQSVDSIDEPATPGMEPLPEYLASVALLIRENNFQMGKEEVQQKLDEGYFSHVMDNGNEFLRRYTTFQYDLQNLLTYNKSTHHQLDGKEYLTGATAHVQHLMDHAGGTLASDPEFEYFDEILSISDNPSFAVAEKNIDQLKWRVIDEMNLYAYFSIDRILGYLLQMMIAERWNNLRKEEGEKKLRKMIDVSFNQIQQKNGTETA